MVYAVILCHGLISWINYYLSKSLYHPGTAYSLVWTLALAGLGMSGDFFFPVSGTALLIYTSGTIAFSAGSHIYAMLPRAAPHPYQDIGKWTVRALTGCLIVSILILPYYIRILTQVGALSGVSDYWVGLRLQTSTGYREHYDIGGASFLGYLLSGVTFVAVAALYSHVRGAYGGIKALLQVALAFSYQILSAGRAGSITLVCSLVCVLGLGGRMTAKLLAVMTMLFILLFAVPAIFLGKGGDKNASLGANMSTVAETAQIYSLAPMVAFDQNLQKGGVIASNMRTTMFFRTLFATLGFNIVLENTLLDYTTTPWLTNVYTIYFPYYEDFGFLGMIVITTFLGFSLSVLYDKARNGDALFSLVYAVGFASIIISPFTENFLTGLSYWIQAALVGIVLFRAPSKSGEGEKRLVRRLRVAVMNRSRFAAAKKVFSKHRPE